MLQVYIEGPNATQQGEEFLKTADLPGRVSTPRGIKSIDAASITQVFEVVKAGAEAAGAIVALAYAIWKWRKEAKAGKVVLEKKKEEGESERLLIDEDTQQAAIEAFLKD